MDDIFMFISAYSILTDECVFLQFHFISFGKLYASGFQNSFPAPNQSISKLLSDLHQFVKIRAKKRYKSEFSIN